MEMETLKQEEIIHILETLTHMHSLTKCIALFAGG